MNKTPIIIIFLLVVFAISYLKNTYVINLFSPDYDLLIKRYYGAEIYNLDLPLVDEGIAKNPRSTSVLLFHLIFALINSGFIYLLFQRRIFQMIHWAAFIGISLIITVAYMIYIQTSTTSFYEIALIFKDFLQSPIYSFLFVILMLNFKILQAK